MSSDRPKQVNKLNSQNSLTDQTHTHTQTNNDETIMELFIDTKVQEESIIEESENLSDLPSNEKR